MTLTEFLLARIAEDEAEATLAEGDMAGDDEGWGAAFEGGDRVWPHITRHGPDRVLRECAAKRRIVEMHAMDRREPDLCATCPSYSDLYPCRTSRALAAVYSDHADYDEAWKP